MHEGKMSNLPPPSVPITPVPRISPASKYDTVSSSALRISFAACTDVTDLTILDPRSAFCWEREPRTFASRGPPELLMRADALRVILAPQNM